MQSNFQIQLIEIHTALYVSESYIPYRVLYSLLMDLEFNPFLTFGVNF